MSSQATSLPRRTSPRRAPTAVCSSQWVGTPCWPPSLLTWHAKTKPARLPLLPLHSLRSFRSDLGQASSRNVVQSVCQFVDTHDAPASLRVTMSGRMARQRILRRYTGNGWSDELGQRDYSFSPEGCGMGVPFRHGTGYKIRRLQERITRGANT